MYRNEALKNIKQEIAAVTINKKLNYARHLLNITKVTNTKFNTLTRVQKYMTTDKKNYRYHHFLNRSSLIAQIILLVELTAYINNAYVIHTYLPTYLSTYLPTYLPRYLPT